MSRKVQPNPIDWILDAARRIKSQCDVAERARAQTAVTMRRRFRDGSKSDRFGFFDMVSGMWLGDEPSQQLVMNLHCINITKNIITANQAAIVQARVECKLEPTSQRKSFEGVANVGTGIYKYLNNHPDYWSNQLENQIAQQMQTDFGVWLRSYWDSNADSPITAQVDEYTDQPTEVPGEFVCVCGARGPLFSRMMKSAEDKQVNCPKGCGNLAEVLQPPSAGTQSQPQQAEFKPGNQRLDVVSMFQIRIDERNTKSGNIRRARYLEHHFLMDEDDLQMHVPYFQLQGASEWSYPIKWEHCLETGSDLYLKPWGAMTSADNRPHEVRRIYLRPEFYRHYRSPIDFTLDRGDGQAAMRPDGKPMLSLKAGEGFIDHYPEGFWVVIDGDQVLPWMDECNLIDEWAYLGFINDSASTYYQPCVELLELQRSANDLWTIDVQQRESASMGTLFYDREWFDANDVEQQLAPTADGKVWAHDDDIRKHIFGLQGLVSPGALEGIKAVQELKGDIVGVQPAMLGKVQPGVAYAAQALQREQSLGRLAPASYSKAEAKAVVIKQQCKLAHKHQPDEWFAYVASIHGDNWRDHDVDDFLNANIERDLSVTYKEDSVVAITYIQKQLASQQVITTLGGLAKAMPNPEKILTPQVIANYGQLMGVEIDIENVEADERLADSRYRKIQERVKRVDPMLPREVFVEKVLASPEFMIDPHENAATAIEFWLDLYTALMADEKPDFPLIYTVIAMIGRHEKANVAGTQEKTANELEGQAPVAAVQKAASDMQGQAAAQAAQAKAQGDAQAAQMKMQTDLEATKIKAQADLQAKQTEAQLKAQLAQQQQDFDMQMKLREEQEAEREREDEAARSQAEFALKAADLAANHPANQPEERPVDKVSESLAYKDLAPPAKRDLLRHVGLSTEGVKDTQIPKPATPTKKPTARPLA